MLTDKLELSFLFNVIVLPVSCQRQLEMFHYVNFPKVPIFPLFLWQTILKGGPALDTHMQASTHTDCTCACVHHTHTQCDTLTGLAVCLSSA